MARWLFKEEPDCYTFDRLEADGEASWDGVTNALALKHLRAVQPGDEVFFYATGKVKAVVGVMTVTAGPTPTADDGKLVSVTVKPVRRLAHPVPLATIKADPVFEGWELVRIARLSVMPVSAAQWKRVEELAKNPPSEGGGTKGAQKRRPPGR
jgi:predicted RNA-binding protein with PUA-like domain